MSQYLNRIEPEDVRFLIDFSEVKDLVIEMLGEARHLVSVEISSDEIQDAYEIIMIRPMIILKEISKLTEENRHTILQSGFSIDREPFENGDYTMEQIFGKNYTILQATSDEDGSFFTIEMPYRDYIHQCRT